MREKYKLKIHIYDIIIVIFFVALATVWERRGVLFEGDPIPWDLRDRWNAVSWTQKFIIYKSYFIKLLIPILVSCTFYSVVLRILKKRPVTEHAVILPGFTSCLTTCIFLFLLLFY